MKLWYSLTLDRKIPQLEAPEPENEVPYSLEVELYERVAVARLPGTDSAVACSCDEPEGWFIAGDETSCAFRLPESGLEWSHVDRGDVETWCSAAEGLILRVEGSLLAPRDLPEARARAIRAVIHPVLARLPDRCLVPGRVGIESSLGRSLAVLELVRVESEWPSQVIPGPEPEGRAAGVFFGHGAPTRARQADCVQPPDEADRNPPVVPRVDAAWVVGPGVFEQARAALDTVARALPRIQAGDRVRWWDTVESVIHPCAIYDQPEQRGHFDSDDAVDEFGRRFVRMLILFLDSLTTQNVKRLAEDVNSEVFTHEERAIVLEAFAASSDPLGVLQRLSDGFDQQGVTGGFDKTANIAVDSILAPIDFELDFPDVEIELAGEGFPDPPRLGEEEAPPDICRDPLSGLLAGGGGVTDLARWMGEFLAWLGTRKIGTVRLSNPSMEIVFDDDEAVVERMDPRGRGIEAVVRIPTVEIGFDYFYAPAFSITTLLIWMATAQAGPAALAAGVLAIGLPSSGRGSIVVSDLRFSVRGPNSFSVSVVQIDDTVATFELENLANAGFLHALLMNAVGDGIDWSDRIEESLKGPLRDASRSFSQAAQSLADLPDDLIWPTSLALEGAPPLEGDSRPRARGGSTAFTSRLEGATGPAQGRLDFSHLEDSAFLFSPAYIQAWLDLLIAEFATKNGVAPHALFGRLELPTATAAAGFVGVGTTIETARFSELRERIETGALFPEQPDRIWLRPGRRAEPPGSDDSPRLDEVDFTEGLEIELPEYINCDPPALAAPTFRDAVTLYRHWPVLAADPEDDELARVRFEVFIHAGILRTEEFAEPIFIEEQCLEAPPELGGRRLCEPPHCEWIVKTRTQFVDTWFRAIATRGVGLRLSFREQGSLPPVLSWLPKIEIGRRGPDETETLRIELGSLHDNVRGREAELRQVLELLVGEHVWPFNDADGLLEGMAIDARDSMGAPLGREIGSTSLSDLLVSKFPQREGERVAGAPSGATLEDCYRALTQAYVIDLVRLDARTDRYERVAGHVTWPHEFRLSLGSLFGQGCQ